MAIRYKVTKQNNPKAGNIAHYGACRCQVRHLSLIELANEISGECSLNSSDILCTFLNLFYILQKELYKGNIVRLGDFGSFRLMIKGKSAAHPWEWNPKLITKASVQFSPGKMLKEAYRDAEYMEREV